MGLIFAINIVDGSALTVLAVLSLAALGYLVSYRVAVRRSDDGLPPHRLQLRRWLVRVGAGAVGGAIAGVIVIYVSEVLLNAFGTPLEADTHAWVIATFAAIGIAAANFWKRRWWRRVVASVSVVLFVATATVAINGSYGLNLTLGSLFNVSVSHPIALPKTTPVPTVSATSKPVPIVAPKPLWQTWAAPPDLAAAGSYGTVSIPNTVSGFVARPAYLYLPPAALVANPPALPVLIMMMGQPGGPESSALFVKFLNSEAAAHHGLGPIVLTVDQIGSPTQNPLCIDSPRGRSYSYVMSDVVNYVRSTLHVAPGPKNWAVGGYSNGGECALAFGAKHPEIFGSILDISGEIGPSLGSPALTVKLGFGGDQAFYDREQPLFILSQHRYIDTVAIFTSGSKDTYYGQEVTTAEAAAKAAGMTTYRFIGQGVGHRSDAVVYGVPAGLPTLYPRWELVPPIG